MVLNTTELKLYLFSRGLKISESANNAWQEFFPGPLTLGEYASTSGVCIRTSDDIYINAPVSEYFATKSEALLVYEDQFFIEIRRERFIVFPIPVPKYHDQLYKDQNLVIPYTELGVTHTDRIRIQPIGGCVWDCLFCDSWTTNYSKKPLQGLQEVIEIAINDQLLPARHVLISGGTPYPEDISWLENIYMKIATSSRIPVDVMVAAWGDYSFISHLKEWGVNAVSINIEVFNEERAKKIIPQKAELTRKYYLDLIEKAVNVFGIGSVQSLLVVGETIENVKSTLLGVEALANRGCMPILSPFRPGPKTKLKDKNPVSYDDMQRLYFESLKICENSGSGVKLGPRCIPCMHNTITFPDNTDFYISLNQDLTQKPKL
jgi:hypothetical protein